MKVVKNGFQPGPRKDLLYHLTNKTIVAVTRMIAVTNVVKKIKKRLRLIELVKISGKKIFATYFIKAND